MKALETFKEMIQEDAEIKLYVTLQDRDGTTGEYRVKNKEDFLNEAVPSGTLISVIANNGDCFTGVYSGTEDYEGTIDVILKGKNSSDEIGLPYDRILGWCERGIHFKDYAEMLIKLFDKNAVIAIAYLYAIIGKEIVTKVTDGIFPVLYFVGDKGTGKSSLAAAIGDLIGSLQLSIYNIDALRDISSDSIELKDRRLLIIDDARYDSTLLKSITDLFYNEYVRRNCGIIATGQNSTNLHDAVTDMTIVCPYNIRDYSKPMIIDYKKMQEARNRITGHLPEVSTNLNDVFKDRFKAAYEIALDELRNNLKDQQPDLRPFAILLAAYSIAQENIELTVSNEDFCHILLDIINHG